MNPNCVSFLIFHVYVLISFNSRKSSKPVSRSASGGFATFSRARLAVVGTHLVLDGFVFFRPCKQEAVMTVSDASEW